MTDSISELFSFPQWTKIHKMLDVLAGEIDTQMAEDMINSIGEILGQGFTGTVYALEGMPDVAIKEIRIDGILDSVLQTLKQEIISMAHLHHHNLLRYKGVFASKDFIYIVMQRYNCSLDTFIKRKKRKHERIPVDLILSVARQLAEALAYLHSTDSSEETPQLPVYHRDLRPANILLDCDATMFVLSDMGFDHNCLIDISSGNRVCVYNAPEFIIQGSYGPASDMWSLGVVIYELATGTRPNFLGQRRPEDVFVDGWIPDLSRIKESVIVELLRQLLVLNPDDRCSAKDLADMLRAELDTNEILKLLVFRAMRLKCDYLTVMQDNYLDRIRALEDENQQQKQKLVKVQERIVTLENLTSSQSTKILNLQQENAHLRENAAETGSLASFIVLTRLLRSLHRNDVTGIKLLIDQEFPCNDIEDVESLLSLIRQECDKVTQYLTSRKQSNSKADVRATKFKCSSQEIQRESTQTPFKFTFTLNTPASQHAEQPQTADSAAQQKTSWPETKPFTFAAPAETQSTKPLFSFGLKTEPSSLAQTERPSDNMSEPARSDDAANTTTVTPSSNQVSTSSAPSTLTNAAPEEHKPPESDVKPASKAGENSEAEPKKEAVVDGSAPPSGFNFNVSKPFAAQDKGGLPKSFGFSFQPTTSTKTDSSASGLSGVSNDSTKTANAESKDGSVPKPSFGQPPANPFSFSAPKEPLKSPAPTGTSTSTGFGISTNFGFDTVSFNPNPQVGAPLTAPVTTFQNPFSFKGGLTQGAQQTAPTTNMFNLPTSGATTNSVFSNAGFSGGSNPFGSGTAPISFNFGGTSNK
ncbi:ATP-dependent Zn protease [Giardia duodenalis]|uniref:non-specific serine/threonine protein kinase n=1 Tax=Giardia intestinalis TaxID=5741 RepID=V6U2A5_GIAIN|nr:ATP-dependent Zn protease [Giardia intestinalis]